MLLTDPDKIKAFLERYFLRAEDYDPSKYRYRFREIWDAQDFALGAGSVTAVEWFSTTRTAHASKFQGCNLANANQLDGNTSMLVTAIRWEPVGCGTASKGNDANLVSEWGTFDLIVNNRPVLEEMPIRECTVQRGLRPSQTDNVAAAGAGVYHGQLGADDGGGLTPESFVPLVDGDRIVVKGYYNGPTNLVAASKWRCSLAGLEARAGANR